MIEQLVLHPNVHADIAGVRRFDLLDQAVRRAGARKILFGTDGPWLHPGVELVKIHLLALPPAEKAMVLGQNFLRLVAAVRPKPLLRSIVSAGDFSGRHGPYRDPWLIQ